MYREHFSGSQHACAIIRFSTPRIHDAGLQNAVPSFILSSPLYPTHWHQILFTEREPGQPALTRG